MDRSGGLRSDMAGNATGEGELTEELADSVLVGGDPRVHLAVGAVQVGAGNGGRTAVSRPGQEDGVDILLADDAVQVGVDEVQPGRRSPVAQQSRLDVIG